MRIDHDYMKEVLDRILENNTADFNLELFSDLWPDEDVDAQQKFVCHLEVLEDQLFIESSTTSLGIGIRRVSNPAAPFIYSIQPLRLTAQGHDFASALNKPGVFEQLKTTFKESGPAETVKATFKLAGVQQNWNGDLNE